MSDVSIQSFPAITVIARRHVGPYREVGPVYQGLMAAVAQAGAAGGLRGVYGLSWDDPDAVAEEELRFDCCVALEPAVAPTPQDRVETIPAGDYAVLRHVGPYERLEDSYRALMLHWTPPEGRELRHDLPCVEAYLNDPCDTPPDQLITEIRAPLA